MKLKDRIATNQLFSQTRKQDDKTKTTGAGPYKGKGQLVPSIFNVPSPPDGPIKRQAAVLSSKSQGQELMKVLLSQELF